MEQTGRVGAVQLAESAARTYAEEKGMAVPPLQTKEINGHGWMRVAFYECATGAFLDGDAGPQDPRPAIPPPSACAQRGAGSVGGPRVPEGSSAGDGRVDSRLAPGFFRRKLEANRSGR